MAPVRFPEFRLTVRISRRARLRLSVRRSRFDAERAGGSRLLYRVLDQDSETGQAGDLHRRIPCAARGGLSTWLAGIRIRPGGRGLGLRHEETRHHNYRRPRLSLARDFTNSEDRKSTRL